MQMLKNAFHTGEIVYHFNLLYSKRKENQVPGGRRGKDDTQLPSPGTGEETLILLGRGTSPSRSE